MKHDEDFEKKVQYLLKVDIPHMLNNGTNFTSCLLRLIAKSDPMNKFKLGQVYPAEVEAVKRWQEGV